MPFIPIIVFVAGAVFGAPTVLGEDLAHELSKNPETMAEYIRTYFTNEPILADIAWCESRLRHLSGDGEIFRGKIDKDDIGIMQVNTRFHEKEAEKLGYDIYTLSGNLAYARYLYKKEGTKPWNSSKPCWSRANP